MITTARQGGTVAVAVLAVVVLAGCDLFGKPPHAEVMNRSDRSVTLTLTGSSVEAKEFPPNQGLSVWGVDGTPIEGRGVCEGDGYVLTDTATGEGLDTSDEPVCGETFIEIEDDGTID